MGIVVSTTKKQREIRLAGWYFWYFLSRQSSWERKRKRLWLRWRGETMLSMNGESLMFVQPNLLFFLIISRLSKAIKEDWRSPAVTMALHAAFYTGIGILFHPHIWPRTSHGCDQRLSHLQMEHSTLPDTDTILSRDDRTPHIISAILPDEQKAIFTIVCHWSCHKILPQFPSPMMLIPYDPELRW